MNILFLLSRVRVARQCQTRFYFVVLMGLVRVCVEGDNLNFY